MQESDKDRGERDVWSRVCEYSFDPNAQSSAQYKYGKRRRLVNRSPGGTMA